MVSDQLMHGLVHPEMGHMLLPRLSGDSFEGACQYQGACWEDLRSGSALMKCWGMPAEHLPSEHESWEIETQYIAYSVANFVCPIALKGDHRRQRQKGGG